MAAEVRSGRYEMVPVAELVPYDGNAKRHTREQIDAVKASMDQLGFGAPLVCWHNDDGKPEIVAGHARAKAAQELGIEMVPVVFRDDWTDAQRRAYTLADNQTTMMTGWDDDQLAYELDSLAGEFDMGDFGFDATPDSDLDDRYSDNVGTVEYEPKDVERKPAELFEPTDRFAGLIDAVQDKTIKRMLRIRADWFCRFDFAKIADYYANQASVEEQEAFEALGLVLLDRDGLIANGFSDLADSIAGGALLNDRPPRISAQHRLHHQQGPSEVHDGADARGPRLPR